jgi:pyruvate,water dikinase
MSQTIPQTSLIRWFTEIGLDDIPLVGGKNASLGEMSRALADQGVRVPNGYAITAEAYRTFLREANLEHTLRAIFADVNPHDLANVRQRGRQARQAILAAPLPPALTQAMTEAYARLSAESPDPVDVAVRSSATAADLPDTSFAGQQETYLNVQGHAALRDACKRCLASLFTDRAIAYRADHGLDHFAMALSIGVQRMVRADLAASGVMFSIDIETGFRDAVLINAAYGLGENVMQGTVTPDEYTVFKPTLHQGFRPILQKRLGTKEWKIVYDVDGGRMTRNVPVSSAERARYALADDDILTLARWACLIEDHYSTRRGRPTPVTMEWAKDGLTGELFVVQAHPETVQARQTPDALQRYTLQQRGFVLVRGQRVGEHIRHGPVRVIQDVHHLQTFQAGEVLVTEKTDPDWEPVMKQAAAIITNRGGRTCHTAMVSRALGIPAVVGTEHGTEVLRNSQVVTVSCAEGGVGVVYDGALPFTVERVRPHDVPRPTTKVMLNVDHPEEAFALSFLPNDGVGLVRQECIIRNAIKVHPLALLDYEGLDDPALKADIDHLTTGYADKAQFFVDRLAQGVAIIAAAFYPKDVMVRLSDFTSNAYAALLGGRRYEPVEDNPLLGFRGASRYYDPRYRDGFALECQALRQVREGMGLTNVKLMVPFCRTVDEGRKVLAEMATHGLRRGEHGLQVYVMCALPSNVMLAEAFAEIFDGFAIGADDLTQLVLGVDRDSAIVAHFFDARDPAVKRMMAHVIKAAKARGRTIGICDQAPSDHPEFAQFLVEQGIESLSVHPDAVRNTLLAVAEMETTYPKA